SRTSVRFFLKTFPHLSRSLCRFWWLAHQQPAVGALLFLRTWRRILGPMESPVASNLSLLAVPNYSQLYVFRWSSLGRLLLLVSKCTSPPTTRCITHPFVTDRSAPLLPLFPADRPQRMNNILTSATEPYDLSLSRSFQNLSHQQPSYELPLKPDLSKYSPHRLSDKDMDDYYPRQHLHPDFGGRGPTHMVKLNAEPHQHQQHQQHQQRQRPRRVQRAMSQDHVLSPPRTPRSRNLSNEQLLSADRLHSQDPLLSPAMRRDKFREKAMARAMSHADMLMPTTPVMDRHKMTKMHSQPSASTDSYNTLMVNHHAGTSTSKRQAFASRRTHTVDHLQYIPGHHHTYRTASKNEVTV
uniref:Shisa family member 6 n=1 Tax=Fundulus heteroclitus TaxID=8078 RepID=A0A3Q2PLJ5_FUNHE